MVDNNVYNKRLYLLVLKKLNKVNNDLVLSYQKLEANEQWKNDDLQNNFCFV